MPPDRIAPVIDKLVGTLQDEAAALDDLNALLAQQVEAVRRGSADTLKDLAGQTHEVTAALNELRKKRVRQMRLLSRVLQVEADDLSVASLVAALERQENAGGSQRLADVRQTVQERAHESRHRGETLQFALEYAAGLNRELLFAMRDAADGDETQTYTAAGQSEAAAAPRSFLNATG